MVEPPSSNASLEETDARDAHRPAHTAREKPNIMSLKRRGTHAILVSILHRFAYLERGASFSRDLGKCKKTVQDPQVVRNTTEDVLLVSFQVYNHWGYR